MNWFIENSGNIIVGLILIGVIAMAVRSITKKKSACSCGCSNCPHGTSCHKTNKEV